MALSSEELAPLRAALLEWYRAHARDLPWRRTSDPYAIWISEVMLQQTRVETVIPYWQRFLERWPTVEALAAADPEDVGAAWSGLGYYRRARSMLEAAARIAARPDRAIPSEPEELADLPGFGRYTTGAVASIAFDRPVAAVDGNVSRVLARLAAIEGDVQKGAANRAVWDLATQLVMGEAPGDLNQALIELGATVCARRPDCGACPVKASCRARQRGLIEVIPPARARPTRKTERWTVLLLHDERRVVLAPRPEGERFSGLWCPPMLPDGERTPRSLSPKGQVTHILTHRELKADLMTGPIPKKRAANWKLVAFDELNAVAVPSFAIKCLAAGLPAHLLPPKLPGRKQPSLNRQAELPLNETGRSSQ